MRCDKCRGDGWYRDLHPQSGEEVQVQCEACAGEGYIYFDWTCPRCGSRNSSRDPHCGCEC